MNLISENGKIAFLKIPGFHFLCGACEEVTILKTTTRKNSNRSSSTDNIPFSSQPLFSPTAIASDDNLTIPHVKDSINQHIRPNVIINQEVLSDSEESVKNEFIEVKSSSIKTHRTEYMKNRLEMRKNCKP